MPINSVVDLELGSGIDELNSFSIPKRRDYPGPNIRLSRTGSMLLSCVADPGSVISELNSFSIPKPRDYPGTNIR